MATPRYTNLNTEDLQEKTEMPIPENTSLNQEGLEKKIERTTPRNRSVRGKNRRTPRYTIFGPRKTLRYGSVRAKKKGVPRKANLYTGIKWTKTTRYTNLSDDDQDDKIEMITSQIANLNKEDLQKETDMPTPQNTNLSDDDQDDKIEMITSQIANLFKLSRGAIPKLTTSRYANLSKEDLQEKTVTPTPENKNLSKADLPEKTEIATAHNTSQPNKPTYSGLINQVTSLQCPICYKFMKDPKLLSCAHTFCLSCLSNIVRKKEISCPICRKDTSVTEDDASKLPTNLAFRSVVEQVANLDGRCDTCDKMDKPDRIAYCLDCNIFMCPSCHKKHNRKTENSNHQVNKTRRSKHFSSLTIEQKFCTDHEKETCVGICIKCNKYVCKECSVIHKHKGHEVQGLLTYAIALHALATPLKNDINLVKEESKSCIRQCQYNKEKTTQHINSVLSQIEDEYQASLEKLNNNKRLAIKACTDIKERMCKLSDDLCNNIEECNSLLNKAKGSIQIVLNSPFGDMQAHNSVLESAKSEIEEMKIELNFLMKKSTNMLKDGDALNFQRKSKRETSVLGELMHHDWVLSSCPLAQPEKDMTCMAVDHEGDKVLVGYFSGGVEIIDGVTGKSPRVVRAGKSLNKVRVMAMSFGNDGNLVLRNIENEISIYGHSLKRYDVKFETLRHAEGGDGDIALDTNNDIYASYRTIRMIHMYRKRGGKPCREIRCDGFIPQQILVMPNLHIIVMDAEKIRIIDERSNTVKSEVIRKGHLAYPAISWDMTLLIAWVNPIGHSVELVKYTNDMEDKKTLHVDFNIDLSGRTWYYCKVLSADKILFCCPKQLHIFTLHTRPYFLQSLGDDHLTVYEC